MKFAEIQEFTKQRKKAQRIKIDKIKETARQLNRDREDNEMNKDLSEIYSYDSESCRR